MIKSEIPLIPSEDNEPSHDFESSSLDSSVPPSMSTQCPWKLIRVEESDGNYRYQLVSTKDDNTSTESEPSEPLQPIKSLMDAPSIPSSTEPQFQLQPGQPGSSSLAMIVPTEHWKEKVISQSLLQPSPQPQVQQTQTQLSLYSKLKIGTPTRDVITKPRSHIPLSAPKATADIVPYQPKVKFSEKVVSPSTKDLSFTVRQHEKNTLLEERVGLENITKVQGERGPTGPPGPAGPPGLLGPPGPLGISVKTSQINEVFQIPTDGSLSTRYFTLLRKNQPFSTADAILNSYLVSYEQRFLESIQLISYSRGLFDVHIDIFFKSFQSQREEKIYGNTVRVDSDRVSLHTYYVNKELALLKDDDWGYFHVNVYAKSLSKNIQRDRDASVVRCTFTIQSHDQFTHQLSDKIPITSLSENDTKVPKRRNQSFTSHFLTTDFYHRFDRARQDNTPPKIKQSNEDDDSVSHTETNPFLPQQHVVPQEDQTLSPGFTPYGFYVDRLSSVPLENEEEASVPAPTEEVVVDEKVETIQEQNDNQENEEEDDEDDDGEILNPFVKARQYLKRKEAFRQGRAIKAQFPIHHVL